MAGVGRVSLNARFCRDDGICVSDKCGSARGSWSENLDLGSSRRDHRKVRCIAAAAAPLAIWASAAAVVCAGCTAVAAPAGTRVVENADEGMRIWNQRGQSEQTWQVLDAVRKVAEGRGVSLAQVSIA